MINRKKVAISIGDLNGIGIQLALQNHNAICKTIEPLYCIDRVMLERAAKKLRLSIPSSFKTIKNVAPAFDIEPGFTKKESGAYAYASFKKAVSLAQDHEVDAICTLPIHKKAWELASIPYKGHTDALRDFFDADAIMMLGSEKMYVALFTEHIPLKDVAASINEKDLTRFLVDFYHTAKPTSTVGVLGLNPHAGDNGVLGDEESIIEKSILNATQILYHEHPDLLTKENTLFSKPLVPDVAFTPRVRKNFSYYVAMYHDQGLVPLKALYFDEGINISLNLPILRTSVDHGTAFDIAYKGTKLNHLSYLNAIAYISKSNA
ncbi:MAG TPA: 4-hydroxythreonine-4-phosphate dehydrogenase [Sulfurovum sp.]|nr:4-hydroxythreonine-4-phosphate dehydrogenase [Sulfurovum sp.]